LTSDLCPSQAVGAPSGGKTLAFIRLADRLLAERERWVLWLPVALGAGIALYFALPVEPSRAVGPVWLVAGLGVAWAGRRRMAVPIIGLALAVAALGFVLAVERSHRVAGPILERPTGMIELSGRINEVEPLERGVRVVLDRLSLPPSRHGGAIPERVRIRLPKDVEGLRPGQWISLRAALLPPPMPAAPGAYDFARQAWFRQLGAVGYAVTAPVLREAPAEEGWDEQLRLFIATQRHRLTERIVGAIDGAGIEPGVGATAAALITAERGPVPPALLQAYRDAGLAHILVIAGMHMSMVAGLVFVALRGLLAAIPPVALRYDIKKWTAGAALLVTLGYLIISGAPVPTQRAFIMNAIVLAAVLIDREAISLRSITWAALAVLVMQPEALVGASFQMSFAAVYGLISGYEAAGPKMAQWRHQGHGWFHQLGFYLLGILLTTQIAGSSTAFYTVFHFNRYATYSLLGNALAVPLVGFWVMPAALLAFCLMPFGLDGWGWQAMGWGIVAVNRVATGVSSLPGATLDLPSMPVSALIVFTLGGFWLLLWKTRWRLWGLSGIAVGLAIYAFHQPPDLLIDASGKLAALRDGDGDLTLSQRRGGRSLRETWIKQAGQGHEAELWDDDPRVRCDALGCVIDANHHLIAIARRPEALRDDCPRAELVVVAVPVMDGCPPPTRFIDLLTLRSQGTHSLWLGEAKLRVETVAQWQGDRPWSHHPEPHRRKKPGVVEAAPLEEEGEPQAKPEPPEEPE
jgi:competence protein ComEC